MKVIGAGFGRTGTMSLKVALEELGVGPCLHPLVSLSDHGEETSSTHWQQIANGEPVNWHSAFDGWGSTVDWIAANFFDELADAFPQARVILSVRDPESWYESCHHSLHATHQLWQRDTATPSTPSLFKVVDDAVWKGVFDGRFSERDYALEVFDRHNAEVARRIPSDRLLVFDIRQGWEPLCDFLGVDVPDAPFPHLNSRGSFLARFGSATRTREVTVTRKAKQPHPSTRGDDRSAPRQVPVPRISALAVSDSPISYTQEQVLDRLGLRTDEFARGIFRRCGVHRRHLNLSDEFLSLTLQGRTRQVEQELMDHSIRCVERLGVDPAEIGTIITASLYSLGCPSLAHRLVDHYEMDPSTDKYHITGVGCASAVPLMRLACGPAAAHPDKHVLVIAAESMSGMLMNASDGDPRAKTVGSAIFGDGCAAALISCGKTRSGPEIVASQVHQIGGTLGAVAMALESQDSYLHLARELPDLAGAGLADIVERFLADNDCDRDGIDHWIVHPGGRRIIESVEEAIDLTRQRTMVSWATLANHGNVGTPSIFYVLKDTIATRQPGSGECGLMVTIGPGVTVGLMLVRW